MVLAEDSFLVREGVGLMIDAIDDLELVASCGDLPSLLRAVEAHLPDVVLTDIRMPPTQTDEGIRAAVALRESHPGIGVVVLSQYIEPAYASRLLDGGTSGRAYLLKERVGDVDELLHAMRCVAAGDSVIDPKVIDVLLSSQRLRTSVLDRLTPREMEVLAHIAQGSNNTAIADALVLSMRAVEKHINSIFTKLDLRDDEGVHHRVRAVLLFLSGARGRPGGAGTPSE